MNFTVNHFHIRNILNSVGKPGVEIEICINDKFYGIGSTPSAIKAGRREKACTDKAFLSSDDFYNNIFRAIKDKTFVDQESFDDEIKGLNQQYNLGSDLTLSLSVAFYRACAATRDMPLFRHISDISDSNVNMPYPMANIFSGGIHSSGTSGPFQQTMIIPRYDTFIENLDAIIRIYSFIEEKMKNNCSLISYSASSGMLVNGYSVDELFQIINDEIKATSQSDKVKIGVDIAAEHLLTAQGNYTYNAQEFDSGKFLVEIQRLVNDHNVFYVEDPFDSDDSASWTQLTKNNISTALIVGDDLFATNPDNIKAGLATGILLKMNQIGFITDTIRAADKAKSLGFTLCVSHRSLETEDTTMCDFAVGIGAKYIKIGGPRRGDRVSKYNQLIRISEKLMKQEMQHETIWSKF